MNRKNRIVGQTSRPWEPGKNRRETIVPMHPTPAGKGTGQILYVTPPKKKKE